jgi:hypothetical protein
MSDPHAHWRRIGWAITGFVLLVGAAYGLFMERLGRVVKSEPYWNDSWFLIIIVAIGLGCAVGCYLATGEPKRRYVATRPLPGKKKSIEERTAEREERLRGKRHRE